MPKNNTMIIGDNTILKEVHGLKPSDMQRIRDFYKEQYTAGVKIAKEKSLPQEIFSEELTSIGNIIR